MIEFKQKEFKAGPVARSLYRISRITNKVSPKKKTAYQLKKSAVTSERNLKRVYNDTGSLIAEGIEKKGDPRKILGAAYANRAAGLELGAAQLIVAPVNKVVGSGLVLSGGAGGKAIGGYMLAPGAPNLSTVMTLDAGRRLMKTDYHKLSESARERYRKGVYAGAKVKRAIDKIKGKSIEGGVIKLKRALQPKRREIIPT